MDQALAPLGERMARCRRFSQAGAGRVRGRLRGGVNGKASIAAIRGRQAVPLRVRDGKLQLILRPVDAH